MKKFNITQKQFKKMLSKGISLSLVGGVTVLVLHPSIWLGFIWSGLHFLFVYSIASIVSRVLFGKGIMAIIKEDEDKEEYVEKKSDGIEVVDYEDVE